MRWSWKGPMALVWLILLVVLVSGFAAGIQLLISGQGWIESALAMVAGCLPLALFVGSGFVAAKVEEYIQRRKCK